MADEVAMAAAATLIEDAIAEPDPVDAVMGAAPTHAEDFFGNDVAAPPVEVSEQTAPAEPQVDLSAFQTDTSGLDWLEDEPAPVDDDDDYTVTPSFDDDEVLTPTTEWDEDEEKTQLRRQLARLEKQNKWNEEQRVKALQKKWHEEAARRFPLSSPGTINATSRRATLREAKSQHDFVFSKVKPLYDAIQAEKQATTQEAIQEGRRTAEQAWGKPMVGGGQGAIAWDQPAPVGQQKLQRGESFFDRVSQRLKSGEYGRI